LNLQLIFSKSKQQFEIFEKFIFFDLFTFSGVVTDNIVVGLGEGDVATLIKCSLDLVDEVRLRDSTEKRRSFEDTLFFRFIVGDNNCSVTLLVLFNGKGMVVDCDLTTVLLFGLFCETGGVPMECLRGTFGSTINDETVRLCSD
jgi:hypothetical protein